MSGIVSALQSRGSKFFPFIPIVNILYLLGMFLFSTIKLSWYTLSLLVAALAAAAAHYLLPPVIATWYVVPMVMGLMLYFKGKQYTYEEHPPKQRWIPAVAFGAGCIVLLTVSIGSQFSNLLHPPLQDKTVQMTQALLDRDESTWFNMLHMRHDSSVSELKGVLNALKKDGIQLKGDITEARLISYIEEGRSLRNSVTDAVFRLKIGETLYRVTVRYVKDGMGEGFTSYHIELAEQP